VSEIQGASGTGSAALLTEQTDGILRLTLNRPDKRNAINDAMMADLIDAIDAAGRDEAVRVIVLAGGGANFCGGADIVARNAPDGRRPRAGSIQRRLPSQAHRLIPLVATVQTPVVCAVQGWAAGIGLALALAADVTIASEDAQFWAPFAERGFTPDSGMTWLLPRRIGEVRARQMLLLGRVVKGVEAADWQLIDRCVPAADLSDEVEAVAKQLAASATVALGLTKWLLATGQSSALEESLRNEAFGLELSSRSEDFREGMTAFREKRSARFEGR
jgi:2-(1,2-epoxy-1,2-dihydrophenyl)acetyl-CoA isomerase